MVSIWDRGTHLTHSVPSELKKRPLRPLLLYLGLVPVIFTFIIYKVILLLLGFLLLKAVVLIVCSESHVLVILPTTHVGNLRSQCAVRSDDNIVLLDGLSVLEAILTVVDEDPETIIGCHFNLRLPLGE